MADILVESAVKHQPVYYYYYYHFMAFCPGLPGWASTRKVKPVWILLDQETSEWQWYQLGHMQICTLPQTDNHASIPPLSVVMFNWW